MILQDCFGLVRILLGYGKIAGMSKVISINRVKQYSSATGLPVRQSGAAAARSLIVFSANSSGFTGIVPTETEKNRIYKKKVTCYFSPQIFKKLTSINNSSINSYDAPLGFGKAV